MFQWKIISLIHFSTSAVKMPQPCGTQVWDFKGEQKKNAIQSEFIMHDNTGASLLNIAASDIILVFSIV